MVPDAYNSSQNLGNSDKQTAQSVKLLCIDF